MANVVFPYKPKTLIFVVSIVFFLICALFLGNIALSNDRGLVLNRIFEFSTQGATIFYWCLTAASGVFVVVGTIALYSGLKTRKEIVLTDDKILAPKSGMSNKIISVMYSEITDLNIQSVQKQRFLNIIHPGGKLTIPQSMLANKQAFDELTTLMTAKVAG